MTTMLDTILEVIGLSLCGGLVAAVLTYLFLAFTEWQLWSPRTFGYDGWAEAMRIVSAIVFIICFIVFSGLALVYGGEV